MDHPNMRDEPLELAFQLAYFIHGDEKLALLIATTALEKLDAADCSQDKRRYYKPTGQRRRVSMPELQLLQRLVYTQSEKQERFNEQADASTFSQATQAIMTKRFIKHLIKITGRRNSLHVTLGLSRLLYDYSAAQTAELYGLVSQAPDRAPDDAYWRSRKAILIGEIKERFGAMLTVERGPRNQERFRTQPTSQRLLSLARECLKQFTPWQTLCHLPERFDPITDELTALSFSWQNPDEEHRIELNRYHALLHPSCFERLVLTLGYDAPPSRLTIPQFLLSTSGNDEDESGNNPPPALGDDDREAVRRHLNRQSDRRLAPTAGLLLFVVDDEVLAKLDPRQPSEVSFTIPRSAEFIEVRTIDREGEVLLAVHPLEFDQAGDLAEQRVEIELAGGQSLKLVVAPTRNIEGAVTGATVQATSPMLPSREAAPAAKTSAKASGWMFGGWLKPAIAFALLLIAFAVMLYLLPNQRKRQEITRVTLTPLASPTTSAPDLAQQGTPAPTDKTSPQPSPHIAPGEVIAPNEVIAMDMRASRGSLEDSATRGEREDAVKQLQPGQKLYLIVQGRPAAARRTLTTIIKQRLMAAGRFQISQNRADAEIALKLTLEPSDDPSRITLLARIVNADGKVIWPLTQGFSGRRYKGPAQKVAVNFGNDLQHDVQKLQRHQ